MKSNEISIGRLSARTGLAVSALRYYESEGLITAARNRAGQRRFVRADIRRVSLILILQQFGLTLAEIRSIMAPLPKGKAPSADDWQRIAGQLNIEIDKRMETLTRLRDNLTGCIGCGCLSLAKCALYNPADRIATFGTGPRYLMGNRPGDG